MAQDKKIVLKNVEVSWAKVQEPETKYMSDEMEYSVSVKMNDQLTKLMSDYKLNKKVKEGKDSTFDGAPFLQISLDEKTRSGWVRHGEVYDKNGEPTQDLVGNGSKMNLFVSIGDSNYGNIIKLGHLENYDNDKKSLYYDFGQVMELESYEKTSAVIKTNAAVNAAPAEEMSIPFE